MSMIQPTGALYTKLAEMPFSLSGGQKTTYAQHINNAHLAAVGERNRPVQSVGPGPLGHDAFQSMSGKSSAVLGLEAADHMAKLLAGRIEIIEQKLDIKG